MYAPHVPMIADLVRCRCVHSSHAESAYGYYAEGGTRSGASAAYPDGFNEYVAVCAVEYHRQIGGDPAWPVNHGLRVSEALLGESVAHYAARMRNPASADDSFAATFGRARPPDWDEVIWGLDEDVRDMGSHPVPARAHCLCVRSSHCGVCTTVCCRCARR